MDIINGNTKKFQVDKWDESQTKDLSLRIDNACTCGCSPFPFITVASGEVGITFEIRTR